jgi:uncharacterized protein YgiM (DUF1202 family)
MSFRSLLATIALTIIPAASVFAQDAVPQPDVANSRFQIQGTINAETVYVRSGPGEGYYPTEQLQKGQTVTVVGIKFDWLKIIPPEGSYSYVGAVFVDRNADGSSGKINRNDVNVRAGSLVNAAKTTVQMRLNSGDQVEIIGKEDEYLKIKPPVGAYLYVNKDFVTVAGPTAADGAPAAPAVAPIKTAAPTIDTSGTIMTSTPTTAPSQASLAAPTTAPSGVAAAPTTKPTVAAAPPPTPEELFAADESAFTEISKLPLDKQPIDDLLTKYQSIDKSDGLSDELKQVVDIRIVTLKARADNQAKLIEEHQLEAQAAQRQLALQAEQQELAERLKQSEIQVFAAVGTLEPSSLQLGGGTLYRLTDPGTGRTVVYVRTSDPKVTGLMGQFVGISGEANTDPQLSLKVIEPTDAKVVDPAKVNGSVMAEIIPPSLLARQASAN